ncbi:MAG TPA: heparan-alpha-glucosaminide N-acetyltransferase domain-containing protein [Pyrinomonadaceae bacterium]|jgi:predicted acyltransferase
MNAELEEPVETAKTGRLISLDAFRGLTIAGMVLVNNPGTWSQIYWPLAHAEWHGWTPTDLIFPFFLFIVGISITLSFARRVENGDNQRALLLGIIRRTVILFALGLVLAGFPYFDFNTIRIPGVLQRISVCYLISSLIFLNTRWRTQAIIAIALLLLYWLLMMLVPVPFYGAGDLSKEGSLASYVDRLLLGPHIWKQGKVYDPEGLLSTIPAISTTLCGVLAGHWLRTGRSQLEKVGGLFFAGVCAVVVGWLWGLWFPLNKSLWTSSYVVFTAGMALLLLGFCYWLIEIKNYRRWAWPFVVFGVNAITLFVGSGLMAKLMGLWKIPRLNGSQGNLQTFIYEHLFASWAQPLNASLLYAVCFLLLWLLLMWLLYRKKIFIKI